MLVLIFVFIAVALPIIVIWTSHAIIAWQDEKQSTSFSAIYAEMQREIKLKEIHRQASAVAMTKKLDWQQDRAYKDEYRRLFLENCL
jgi:hypothetical protein